jgi:hypothetical protein
LADPSSNGHEDPDGRVAGILPEAFIKVPATACGGCIVAVIVSVIVIFGFVRPAQVRPINRERCVANRQRIVQWELEQRRKTGSFASDLRGLNAPAVTRCPDEGIYSVELSAAQLRVRCSIPYHDDYRAADCTIAIAKP